MDDMRLWVLLALNAGTVLAAGAGAWAAVRVGLRLHVHYLSRDIEEVRDTATEAHRRLNDHIMTQHGK